MRALILATTILGILASTNATKAGPSSTPRELPGGTKCDPKQRCGNSLALSWIACSENHEAMRCNTSHSTCFRLP
jgi:hypothetical protein